MLDSELIIRDYSKEGKDLLFQEGTVEICITNSLEVVKDFTDGGLMIMFLRRLKIVLRAWIKPRLLQIYKPALYRTLEKEFPEFFLNFDGLKVTFDVMGFQMTFVIDYEKANLSLINRMRKHLSRIKYK